MDTIIKLAERLSEVRGKIDEESKIYEEKVSAIKTERDALQMSLIAELEKANLKSIKTNRENYALAVKHGVSITNETTAFKWALENMAVAMDKRLIAQKLKDVEVLPSGFEKVDTKYISIRKNNNNNEKSTKEKRG